MPAAAVIYARSSKDRSDISTQTQVHELTQLAESRSLTVVRTFEDAVALGSTDDRPAFGELVAAIKNPRRGWDTVLVYDTSRIARGRHIAQAFKHLAKKAGVTILYARLPSDIDPIAEMVLHSVFEAMDEAHSLMSRDKALAGMRENVRRGWRAGGRPPLGYQLEHIPTGAVRDGKPVMKSRLVPSPDAPKVAEYLRRRATGEPRTAVMRAIGVDWKPNSMVDVERRALAYAGHLVWNQHKDGKRVPREQWLVQRDAFPALISEEEAEAVMRLTDSDLGARVSAGKRAASAAMLTGLLWAPDGRAWRSAGKAYRLEGRPGRVVLRDQLENAVLGAVLADFEREEFLAELIAAARERAETGRREQLQAEAAKLRRERDRAARLALEREDDVYPRLVSEKGRQIAGIERQLAALSEDDETVRLLRALTPAMLRDALETYPPADLLAAVVARVVVGPDLTGTIEYRSAVSMASPRHRHGYGTVTRPVRLILAA